MWEPDISNVIHRIPEHSLLRKAVKKAWMRIGEFPLHKYYDDYGMYAYRFAQGILCAKERPYGNIVSCHLNLVFDAKDRKIPIVMWLDSAKTFYAFDPNEIIKNNKGTNDKGSAKMINFDIKLGKRVEFK